MTAAEFALLQDALAWAYGPVLVWLAGLFLAAIIFGSLWMQVSAILRYAFKRE